MKVQIEFDLIEHKLVVTWPWGTHSFNPYGDELVNFTEAMRNFAIGTKAFSDPTTPTEKHLQITTLRTLVEASAVEPKRYNSRGKRIVPDLDDLDLDFSSLEDL